MSLTITNTGKRRGTEVVQLYAADTATGVTLPAQQLIGFARVDLEPGATKSVSFAVPMSVLAYTGLSGELVMEPGPVEVSACSSSDDIRSKVNITVTGKTRVIKRRGPHVPVGRYRGLIGHEQQRTMSRRVSCRERRSEARAVKRTTARNTPSVQPPV